MLLKAYMKGLTMLKRSAETSCLGKEEETLVSFQLHVVRLRRLATTIGNAGRKGIEIDIQQSWPNITVKPAASAGATPPINNGFSKLTD